VTSHEFLDHISETVLSLRAANLPSLLEEGARALGEIEQAGIAGTGERMVRHLAVESTDTAGLLVDFLNELIWLCETESAAPRDARVQLTGPASLEADVALERLAAKPSLVKAATRHGVKVESSPGGWEARVTLDV
jgi:SHS2 domain-containing protein